MSGLHSTDTVRKVIEAERTVERERCALIAERMFPRGSAHTYASENADRYRAQEETCALIAAAIRRDPVADPVAVRAVIEGYD